jgi:hypothetical protein
MGLRRPLAILNELSVPTPEQGFSAQDGATVLRQLVALLQASAHFRPDLAVVSPWPLAGTPITQDGLSFAAVADQLGGEVLEHWRFLRSRQNVAPFSAVPELSTDDHGTEWHFEQRPCTGLGLASAAKQLAISLSTDDCWSFPELTLVRSSLVELEEDDDLQIEERSESVKHAAHAEHVAINREFIADLALPFPFSGDDLWADREHRYSGLRFLPRVETQLRKVPHGAEWVSSIHHRLDELDQAVREWSPAATAFPNWRSHVTPEHEQRKHLCNFTDELDGETHCFDQHARFTPGAGRIYFRIVHENPPSLRIAHIGEKLD